MSTSDSLLAAFESASHSIFRLELRQHYAGDPNFDRFLAAEAWQDTESKQHWVDLVRRRTTGGVVMQRVHVVDRPWSDYIRFEIAWSYPHNVRAGEDVRITTEPHAAYDAAGDFWLFDNLRAWAMHYDPADELISAEDRTTDPAFVAACCRAKTVALATGEPLAHVSRTVL